MSNTLIIPPGLEFRVVLIASDDVPRRFDETYFREKLALNFPAVAAGGAFNIRRVTTDSRKININVFPLRQTPVTFTGFAAALANTLSRLWSGFSFQRVAVLQSGPVLSDVAISGLSSGEQPTFVEGLRTKVFTPIAGILEAPFAAIKKGNEQIGTIANNIDETAKRAVDAVKSKFTITTGIVIILAVSLVVFTAAFGRGVAQRV